jgi:peptidoglycan hydrolase CwlO-like protein
METIAALLGGGVLGAIVATVLKYLTNRREQTLTNEEKLREELQEQIDILKRDVQELRTEVSHWREKYFEIYEEHVQLKARLGE